MFVLSQYMLNYAGLPSNQMTTYSIVAGLILYGSIYLYILFYNNEYLSIFNKFIIYIIVLDLILSGCYYFSIKGYVPIKKFINHQNIENYIGNPEGTEGENSEDYIEDDIEDDIEDIDTEEQGHVNIIEDTIYEPEESEQELLQQESHENIIKDVLEDIALPLKKTRGRKKKSE